MIVFVCVLVCFLQRSAVLIIMMIHNDSIILCDAHSMFFVCVCVCGYRSSVTFPVGRSLMWFFSSTQLSAEVNLCHPNTHRHTRECVFSASVAEWVNLQSVLMLCDSEGWLQRQDTRRQQRPRKTHTHTQTQAILIYSLPSHGLPNIIFFKTFSFSCTSLCADT